MRKILLIVFIVCGTALPQDGTWVETSASCLAVNISVDQAKKKALDDARSEAIKQVVGVRVSEETFRNVSEVITGDNASQFNDLFSKFNRTSSYGKIVEESVIYKSELEGDYPRYTAYLRARVVEEKGIPDPAFTAEIVIGNSILYDRGSLDKNDKLMFKLWASTDSYLYLFNILSNDSVQLILPNEFIPDNSFITSKSEQIFEKKIKNTGMTFPVMLPEGKESVTEGLMLIALKEKVDFVSPNLSPGGIISTYKAAITDIMNWLVGIPLEKRTESFQSFEIRKK